jgi:hypothetical protein
MAPRIVDMAVKKTGAVPNLAFEDLASMSRFIIPCKKKSDLKMIKKSEMDFNIFTV